MNKSTVIKFLDFLSFVSLTLMLSTGVFLRYTLPPRSGGDEVWGFSRHDWGNVHFYLSVIFLVLMSAHLVMHAKFIKSAILGKAPTEKYYRLAVGIVGAAALIALSFAPVISPINDNNKGHKNYHEIRE